MSAAEGFGADRTPWGAVLRAALEALSRSLTKPSLDVQPSPRTFGPAVPDQGTIVLYVLSTLAQTCAALAAFVGVVGVYATHRMSVEKSHRGVRVACLDAGHAVVPQPDRAPSWRSSPTWPAPQRQRLGSARPAPPCRRTRGCREAARCARRCRPSRRAGSERSPSVGLDAPAHGATSAVPERR